MEFFPGSFQIWQYSPFGRALFYGQLAAGVALVLAVRPLRSRLRLLDGLALALALIAVTEHLTALWTLAVDPGRGTGTLPIPQPFKALGYTSVLLFDLAGPLIAGVLAGRAIPLSPRVLLPRALAYLAVAGYALYISPWAGVVIVD